MESNGYSVVRDFVGHGVGAQLHEEPEVRNFGAPGHGPRMLKGMTLAIEPMVNQGAYDVMVLKDKWTTVTADGSLRPITKILCSLPTASRKFSPSPRGCSMEIGKSDIVLSVAGRDQGKLFYVMETDGAYVLVANGRERRLECPQTQEAETCPEGPSN